MMMTSLSQLYMDDSFPLGNTIDVFDLHALHVIIGNSATEAIPVYFAPVPSGAQAWFQDAAGAVTTPGVEQTLITYVVPVNKVVSLQSLKVTCRIETSFKILVDALVIGSGRTGAAIANACFDWTPERDVIAGQTITVKALVMSGRAAGADLEAYLQGIIK
jgi:hypothetical protein